MATADAVLCQQMLRPTSTTLLCSLRSDALRLAATAVAAAVSTAVPANVAAAALFASVAFAAVVVFQRKHCAAIRKTQPQTHRAPHTETLPMRSAARRSKHTLFAVAIIARQRRPVQKKTHARTSSNFDLIFTHARAVVFCSNKCSA